MSEKFIGLESIVRKLKGVWNLRCEDMYKKLKAEKANIKSLQEELNEKNKICENYEKKCKQFEDDIIKYKSESGKSDVIATDLTKLTEENKELMNQCAEYEAKLIKLNNKFNLISQKSKEAFSKLKDMRSNCERIKVAYQQTFGTTLNPIKGKLSQLKKLIYSNNKSNLQFILECEQDTEEFKADYEAKLARKSKIYFFKFRIRRISKRVSLIVIIEMYHLLQNYSN